MSFDLSPKRARFHLGPSVNASSDLVQDAIHRAAAEVTATLKASYDTYVFAEAVCKVAQQILKDADPTIVLEKSMPVPIWVKGRFIGLVKVPYAFMDSSDKPLLLFEVKTKKTALKETDLEDLGCAVEQLARLNAGERPRAMVLNFAQESSSSLVLHEDRTVTAGYADSI